MARSHIHVAARALALCVAFTAQGLVAVSFEADAERYLIDELASGRLGELEAELRPIYEALPKDASGHLGHQAVRYAVHRLFAKRRGWLIKGLEPARSTVRPGTPGSDWVPAFLQGLLEQRVGDRGVDLHGLAAFAAALEDLIRVEADERLEMVYQALSLPTTESVSVADAKRAVVAFLTTYLQAGDFSAVNHASQQQGDGLVRVFGSNYVGKPELAEWLEGHWEGRSVAASTAGALDFAAAQHAAEAIGEQFSTFNDHECKSLKTKLLSMEDKKPGRVPLKEFYVTGLLGQWPFTQKLEYLRTLGALDESDRLYPRLIVPNYLESKPHCLDVSGFYSMCCRNECEDLMGQLERNFVAPSTDADLLAALVANLSSDTVIAPRVLSKELVRRLSQIADQQGGRVQLHSRLFAQWMHHAFPRECPYPHEAAAAGLMTPDEWLKEEGAGTADASDVELLAHVGKFVCLRAEDCAGNGVFSQELPWSSTEKLIAPREHYFPVEPAAGRELPRVALAVVILALMALGFLLGQSSSDARIGGKRQKWMD